MGVIAFCSGDDAMSSLSGCENGWTEWKCCLITEFRALWIGKNATKYPNVILCFLLSVDVELDSMSPFCVQMLNWTFCLHSVHIC